MKTVLITGGNKGIGLETTRYFLEHDYEVIVLARDFSTFPLADHAGITMVEYDLSDIDGIPNLVRELDPIDVLINNAGIMYSLPYDDYPTEKIHHLMALNLEAPVQLMQEVGEQMAKSGSGRIVNNASIAGQIGHPDVWYGMSKAALINATKSFSKIFGPAGVLINAVAPSPAETDMLEVIPEARREAFKQNVITGRFATAKEVAETIGWLGTASPEYINGVCIDINNGAFPR
uniref:Short-chain alcohol dehydrogenase homolog n=1 Tax=Hydrogenovibrio crunogenus (strain DSM 25203 / XCL-2) TaxID=317025 RepID=Q31H33_HYDCU